MGQIGANFNGCVGEYLPPEKEFSLFTYSLIYYQGMFYLKIEIGISWKIQLYAHCTCTGIAVQQL